MFSLSDIPIISHFSQVRCSTLQRHLVGTSSSGANTAKGGGAKPRPIASPGGASGRDGRLGICEIQWGKPWDFTEVRWFNEFNGISWNLKAFFMGDIHSGVIKRGWKEGLEADSQRTAAPLDDKGQNWDILGSNCNTKTFFLCCLSPWLLKGCTWMTRRIANQLVCFKRIQFIPTWNTIHHAK